MKPTPVYDDLWHLAAERMNIFWRRAAGYSSPQGTDSDYSRPRRECNTRPSSPRLRNWSHGGSPTTVSERPRQTGSSITAESRRIGHMTELLTLYFGVWPGTTAGHYLRGARGENVGTWYPDMRKPPGYPLPWHVGELDGGLCPGPGNSTDHWKAGYSTLEHQGEALMHRKDGWYALSFWDSSGDKRAASCSNFFLKSDDDLSFDDLVLIFREQWPELWERFDFEVKEE